MLDVWGWIPHFWQGKLFREAEWGDDFIACDFPENVFRCGARLNRRGPLYRADKPTN